MKQGETVKLGSSLAVPYVQELVKEPLTTIPCRYARPDQDHPSQTASPLQIPVIDLQVLLYGDDDRTMNSELQKLHNACKQWGYFQLINHGVNTSLVEKVKSGVEDFFKSPLEKKKEFLPEAGDLQGYGQAFVVSEEQKLDWADMFYIVTLPKDFRKPHLFSKLPLQFRETIEAYSGELKGLAMKLLDKMEKALEVKDGELREVFEEGMQAMRMNYFPPCPQPELAIGLSPHSDGTGLTILLQISELEGLQIKKDGVWLPVKPLPNSFIVNIGDMLEIVTNGSYPSMEHRVTVNSEKERLSIATFLNAKLHGNLGPAPSLLSPQSPPLFETISVKDFFGRYFSRQLQGRAHLDAMKIGSNSSGHK